MFDRAIVKQLACAAAISCSGLVPFPAGLGSSPDRELTGLLPAVDLLGVDTGAPPSAPDSSCRSNRWHRISLAHLRYPRRPGPGHPAAAHAADRGSTRRGYFTELADIRSAGRKLTEEEWIEVWARHDQYPA
jgi:hypothetical protein